MTFSKKAGQRASAWSQRFQKDHASDFDLTNYSIAMLEGAPRILRGMIKSGIRKGVPREAHSRFLIVTRDEAAWKRYLNVNDPDVPYLVVINGDGQVVWKGQGIFTDEIYQQLKTRLPNVPRKKVP